MCADSALLHCHIVTGIKETILSADVINEILNTDCIIPKASTVLQTNYNIQPSDYIGRPKFSAKANTIVSYASVAKCYKDVSQFSLKVLSKDNTLPATSNVLVYSFTDRNGELHEGYCNDREFGAGQCILKKMKEKDFNDRVLIMSRKVGEHLGIKRFSVFEDNATSALDILKE